MPWHKSWKKHGTELLWNFVHKKGFSKIRIWTPSRNKTAVGGGGALEKPIEVKKYIFFFSTRQVGTFTIYVSVGTDDEWS